MYERLFPIFVAIGCFLFGACTCGPKSQSFPVYCQYSNDCQPGEDCKNTICIQSIRGKVVLPELSPIESGPEDLRENEPNPENEPNAPEESSKPDETLEEAIPETPDETIPETPQEANRCQNGQTRTCYNASSKTKNIGICKPGIQTCVGERWSRFCKGEITPQKESCDGKDNDCDGKVDNVFNLGSDCPVGIGECQKTGKLTCDSKIRKMTCVGTPGKPVPEVCGDGKDNNCNGNVDENCKCQDGAQRTCPFGIGACKNQKELCVKGVWSGCTRSIQAKIEICDGVDNDCDGATDEGCPCTLQRSRPCGISQGVCKKGYQQCALGIWSNCKQAILPQPEKCDGKDNNCNGNIDEGCRCKGPMYSCQANCGSRPGAQQPCQNNMLTYCPKQIFMEICKDNKDNDCNGQIDDGCQCHTGEQRQCGARKGNCAGTQTCKNDGTWSPCYFSKPLQKEKCNDSIDNDCDGSVDEGCICQGIKTRRCGTNRGICEEGIQSCSKNIWGVCIWKRAPYTIEICGDHLDNNCNGSVDEGCQCSPKSKRNCNISLGSATKDLSSPCNGTQKCIADRNTKKWNWGPCEVQKQATKELCGTSKIDDDCDGLINESSTSSLSGNQCSIPNQTCQGLTNCQGQCIQSLEEICRDGVDNNCNSDSQKIDEICGLLFHYRIVRYPRGMFLDQGVGQGNVQDWKGNDTNYRYKASSGLNCGNHPIFLMPQSHQIMSMSYQCNGGDYKIRRHNQSGNRERGAFQLVHPKTSQNPSNQYVWGIMSDPNQTDCTKPNHNPIQAKPCKLSDQKGQIEVFHIKLGIYHIQASSFCNPTSPFLPPLISIYGDKVIYTMVGNAPVNRNGNYYCEIRTFDVKGQPQNARFNVWFQEPQKTAWIYLQPPIIKNNPTKAGTFGLNPSTKIWRASNLNSQRRVYQIRFAGWKSNPPNYGSAAFFQVGYKPDKKQSPKLYVPSILWESHKDKYIKVELHQFTNQSNFGFIGLFGYYFQ